MKETIDIIKKTFSSAVIETHDFRGDDTVVLKKEYLREACHFLQEELGFSMLIDLCAVDYPDREERFEVVYHLYALEKRKRLRLKIRTTEKDACIPTIYDIWRGADWFEREAFDLFGIRFEGHHNLKRLLTFEGFKGHPLRKDYAKDTHQAIPKSDPLVSET